MKLGTTKLPVGGVAVTSRGPEDGVPGPLAAGGSRILPWTW